MAGKPVDRLTNLPSGIVADILTSLPLRDAVTTMMLSTPWRHKWASIPHLIFDFDERSHHNLAFIVNHILLRHKAPILKFSFKIDNHYFDRHDDVDDWLHFLSNTSPRIEDFALLIITGGDSSRYPIPQSMFSFQHLRHLHLRGVKIELPLGFRGFQKLVTLNLEDVLINALDALISKFPMLEFLRVQSFDETEQKSLHIIAPNLKVLDFVGRFSSINLKCPSIKKVWLVNVGINDELPRSESNLVTVFRQMASVEHVRLQSRALMKFLGIGGVPQELPNKLNRLTRLDMNIGLGFPEYTSICVCLIKSSPNLKCLQIVSSSFYFDGEAIQLLKTQQECAVQLGFLKSVRIDCTTGVDECEMELAKLLLLWGSALERMEVGLKESRCLCEERCWVLQHLGSFKPSTEHHHMQ